MRKARHATEAKTRERMSRCERTVASTAEGRWWSIDGDSEAAAQSAIEDRGIRWLVQA